MKKITLYCDGSSLGNPGFGGWATILQYQNNKKIIKGSESDTTNNRMELKAVVEGLKHIKESCEITIISDSKYVCDGINNWLKNWIIKDFKKVKNPDLWREYLALSKKHVLKASWVKGHNGHIENEECDKIAKNEANILKMAQTKLDSKTTPKQKPNPQTKLDLQKPLPKDNIDKNTKKCDNENLNTLQTNIKYFFKDSNLLILALTHKSYDKFNNNERLEFLGDAVLDLLIGEYVFKKLPKSNEGDLTKLRASMVNESSFTKLALAINLGEYLFISSAEIRNKGRNKPSILSNAFEALIGAIYLDSGLQKARILTYYLLELVYKTIDLDSLFKDYKTLLQELTQSLYGATPEYILVNSTGPDHNKRFRMKIIINNKEYATGSGKSKKEAEQNCAKTAYESLKRQTK